MDTYSLYQVNEYIRRVIALNFREPLWVEAEIIQYKLSNGHYYIELAEKDTKSNAIIAQASAVIWVKNFQFIKRKLGDIVFDLLTEGTQVRLKCRVEFNERFGFKLLIEDIDPNFTFGQIELKRQKVIKKLKDEGLFYLNQELDLPPVVQKIAVISSKTAAGLQDFMNQLNDNLYGYKYHVQMYHTAVQGVSVEPEISAAIDQIISIRDRFDAVVIIRGGGSKLDLAAFDNYAIAQGIALSNIPFIIGIGHDIDSTVVDMVSCVSLKTPTAVADYLIERNMRFESEIENYLNQIQRNSTRILNNAEAHVRTYTEKLFMLSQNILNNQKINLNYIEQTIGHSLKNIVSNNQQKLDQFAKTIENLDPDNILKRGYTYTLRDRTLIKSSSETVKDDELDLYFHDGHKKIKVVE